MPKKKILIIDDDADFNESIKVVLKSKGYEVFSAVSADKGLRQIVRIHPDLIILDVMMDKMSDGFDISRKIKKNKKYQKIPIFILTAIGDITGFKLSLSAGDKAWLPVEAYAEKPIKPEVLLSKVKELIRK